jgi:hypothetical protein
MVQGSRAADGVELRGEVQERLNLQVCGFDAKNFT